MRNAIYTIATRPLLLVICLAVGFLVSSLVRAQGRAPAVLPEMGLSIEERRQTPPEEAREFGFNFKPSNTVSVTAATVKETLQPKSELEASTTLIIFGLAVLAMPLFLWFGLMRQLKKQRAETMSNTAPISLEAFRNRQESKKTQEENKERKVDLPKAS